MNERNDVIRRKDNTIQELRSYNIHLMNFHFVLNQKIGSLKEEREPIDLQIREKEENIRQMYNELIGEFSDNKVGKDKNKTLNDKIKAVEQLNNELKQQIFDSSKKLIAAWNRERTRALRNNFYVRAQINAKVTTHQ